MLVYKKSSGFLRFGMRFKQANSNLVMQPKKSLGLFLCACCTSLFFVIFGILLVSLWSVIYEAILRSTLILKPGSAAHEMWKKNPIPLTLKLHIFNWTNAEDIYNSSIKPRFKQVGPYTFTETKEKSSVVWNSNNTVSYKHLKKWWFDPSRSNGSLSDVVRTISPVTLSAASKAKNWHYVLKKGLSFTLTSLVDKIHVDCTVGGMLFEGYEEPLLTMATKMPMVPKGFPVMDKFGWFYGRNGSEDYEGTFNMDTGVTGQIGELKNWKFLDHTYYYPGRCGRFDDSSAGEFFPRKLTKSSVIKMFSPDLCRFMELEYEREVMVNGLIGYKYAAGDKFLDNGTKIPENKCFCDGDCMPSGALNVSNCRHGSPAFVSLPHFYKADHSYLDAVEGIHPSPESDDFYMVFEPNTAVPLEVSARLQLNLRVEAVSSVRLFEGIPTFYFPVLFFEQRVTIPEDMTFKIKVLVNFKIICWAIGLTFISMGLLILTCSCYKLCTKNLFGRKKRKMTLPSKEEVPLNQ